MSWKNVNINTNLIKTETSKSVLINCPHSSKYDGFCFWHSAKLVRNGRHSAAVSIGYTDDFTFKLKKYGKGKYNSRDVISEVEISVSEFEEMFGVINENVSAPVVKNPYETHKPQTLEVTEVEALEDLKDE